MIVHSIESAPRDGTPILAYGAYSWERIDPKAPKGWLVVSWNSELQYDDDCNPVGGWQSVTNNPYSDYMVATLWSPLPALTGDL